MIRNIDKNIILLILILVGLAIGFKIVLSKEILLGATVCDVDCVASYVAVGFTAG
jgi:hypothetical protein